jgi:hypothetical protein
VAVSDGYDEGGFGEAEEPTPTCAERVVARCLPCLGLGRIRLVEGLLETRRQCPVCRGAGVAIIRLRDGREAFVADEMVVADTGRCRGAFRTGRRAPFGRVVCPECRARFRPLPGQRVPNHVSERRRPPVS